MPLAYLLSGADENVVLFKGASVTVMLVVAENSVINSGIAGDEIKI